MTVKDDRIVRIAQKFFDSITFSLKEQEESLEIEIKEDETPLDDSKSAILLKYSNHELFRNFEKEEERMECR